MDIENNPQEDLREIEELTTKLELDKALMIGNRIYRLKREIKQIAERNKFEGGCGKDLCPKCQTQKKIQEIAKEVLK